MHKYPLLLIVDDDARLCELLKEFLTRNDFEVFLAEDVKAAHTLLEKKKFDAIILDVMLPGKTGVEWTREIKAQGNTIPILLLTARVHPEERIAGLEAGADDYLAKPFEPKELLLRLQNLLKRTQLTTLPQRLVLGVMEVDLSKGIILRNGRETFLSSTELNLLRSLSSRIGEPFSREELSQLSGGYISERSIDVQITRLRQKIEEDSSQPRFIQTVRHKGYVLWTDRYRPMNDILRE
ncbi:MAG: response regulator [Holosporales bacterium]|jgi:two-component system phosphate regulon response regulator OmpR|nr:response regulator [Holosporales bacterium]